MPTKGLKNNWPKPPDLRNLSPEERVNTAIEMRSVMERVVLDSIRDRHPDMTKAEVLKLARRRILEGRNLSRYGLNRRNSHRRNSEDRSET